ncbi:hypothetical protein Bca4012_019814 [Brassica carinata]
MAGLCVFFKKVLKRLKKMLKQSNSESFSSSSVSEIELEVKEGGSKYELRKSKSVLSSYESDSCADADSKIHRSSDSKSPMVKKANGANKNSKGHECPICFKVFKSDQTLGGHKRSHYFESQEHIIKPKAAGGMCIDLNLPSQDVDE